MKATGQYRSILRWVLLIFGLALLNGCFLDSVIGPGYFVRLTENSSGCTQARDFGALEDFAVAEQFRKTHSHEDNVLHTLYYRRDLNEDDARKLRYRFISIWLSCDYRDDALSVTVMNDWEGWQVAAKMEIDRLSDRYVLLLERQYGEGTVREIRKRTGPPF